MKLLNSRNFNGSQSSIMFQWRGLVAVPSLGSWSGTTVNASFRFPQMSADNWNGKWLAL